MQVQGDAHAVDKDDALIQELLVRNLSVHELFESGSQANKLNRLGSAFVAGRELVEDRKIKELEFYVRGNPVGQVFELGGKKEVKALGGAFVDGASGWAELERVAEGQHACFGCDAEF